jgi:RNA polymerase-binding transcription factor DksA
MTITRQERVPTTATMRARTEDQRAHVVRRLLEERNRIVRRLSRYRSESAGDVGSVNRVPLHMADVGSDTMQEALDAAFASRDSRILAEIDDALRRFYRDPGGFGVDEGTGAPIAFERLDIIPWTRRA